jgi:hypothetical protein
MEVQDEVLEGGAAACVRDPEGGREAVPARG